MEDEDSLLDASSADALEQETSRAFGKETRQVLLAVVMVAAFLALAHFTPVRAWIENVQVWKTMMREYGLAAHGLFFLACAGCVMLGVPRLAFCSAGGLIFGFGEGLVISLLGSTCGSYGGVFALAAWIPPCGGIACGEVAVAEKMLRKPSVMRVFWVRQLMVPGLVLNVLLGMTPVRHSRFLLGTLLGYLPLNVAFSLVGSGLGKKDLAQSMVQLLAALAVINIAGWLVYKMVKKQARSAEPT
ncbi:MAG: TVP38/TMEM64 family protein [Verrucomicrobiaceae bacterium]|nr:TVP38/TMEM64 family protein [Verrucomicrobiaceae bacterium]